jgi:hypothetical protein
VENRKRNNEICYEKRPKKENTARNNEIKGRNRGKLWKW